MAERENDSYHLPSHNAEHGNKSVLKCTIVQKATDSANDVIVLKRMPREALYFSLRTAAATLTTGLVLKLGVRALDGSFTDDDYFGSVTMGTGGDAQEQVIRPKYALNGTARIDHEIIATLTGTITADEEVDVIAEYENRGAPI